METVTIDRLVPGGQGIGTLKTGQKAFVWGVLPGETVEFSITKRKPSFVEGVVHRVVTPSPHRVDPKDACHLATSSWQIMDYDFELAQKSALVKECFRQQHIDLPDLPPTATDGKSYFYRNKMEYSLYWDNIASKIRLAFHARGTHRKLPIDQSSLENPAVFAAATKLVDELNLAQKSACDYQAILVRSDSKDDTRTALYKKRQPHPKLSPLTDTICGHSYSYSPNGFFQINLPVYELALQAIQPHIQTAKVIDLYAGVGTIGLSVARDRDLTLVEVDKSAFLELTKNCPPSARPVLAKSEAVLDFIAPDTTVIVDPPRAGCDPKLIERLASVRPPAIIYLSCNPITQARDLAPLLEVYKITACQTFNFFPRTPHIEHLTVLTAKH